MPGACSSLERSTKLSDESGNRGKQLTTDYCLLTTAMAKSELKSRMKNLLMFLPNMVVLSFRLMVDSRVPRTERALFAAAVIYAIVPLDFIPDMLPFVGQIDDLFLISLTLLRLIDRTDARVVREHWRGGGDVVQLAESAATVAPLLIPRRISRVLLSKVKPTAEGTGLLVNASKFEPLLVEVPERMPEQKPNRKGESAEGSRKKRESKSA